LQQALIETVFFDPKTVIPFLKASNLWRDDGVLIKWTHQDKV